MESFINLLLSERTDFIPCKYLVLSVIAPVLPLSALLITKSILSITVFNDIDSTSD